MGEIFVSDRCGVPGEAAGERLPPVFEVSGVGTAVLLAVELGIDEGAAPGAVQRVRVIVDPLPPEDVAASGESSGLSRAGRVADAENVAAAGAGEVGEIEEDVMLGFRQPEEQSDQQSLEEETHNLESSFRRVLFPSGRQAARAYK